MPRVTDLLTPEVSPVKGCLQKMAAALPSRQDEQVVYHLRAGEHRVALNERIGAVLDADPSVRVEAKDIVRDLGVVAVARPDPVVRVVAGVFQKEIAA